MSKWPKEWWKQITPKRGEIYWVNFSKLEEKDTSQGTEINGKTRPAVVISNNLQNEKGRRVVILPMSTTIDKYPYRFDLYVGKIINNYQASKVICEQVRSIDFLSSIIEKHPEIILLTSEIKAFRFFFKFLILIEFAWNQTV